MGGGIKVPHRLGGVNWIVRTRLRKTRLARTRAFPNFGGLFIKSYRLKNPPARASATQTPFPAPVREAALLSDSEVYRQEGRLNLG